MNLEIRASSDDGSRASRRTTPEMEQPLMSPSKRKIPLRALPPVSLNLDDGRRSLLSPPSLPGCVTEEATPYLLCTKCPHCNSHLDEQTIRYLARDELKLELNCLRELRVEMDEMRNQQAGGGSGSDSNLSPTARRSSFRRSKRLSRSRERPPESESEQAHEKPRKKSVEDRHRKHTSSSSAPTRWGLNYEARIRIKASSPNHSRRDRNKKPSDYLNSSDHESTNYTSSPLNSSDHTDAQTSRDRVKQGTDRLIAAPLSNISEARSSLERGASSRSEDIGPSVESCSNHANVLGAPDHVFFRQDLPLSSLSSASPSPASTHPSPATSTLKRSGSTGTLKRRQSTLKRSASFVVPVRSVSQSPRPILNRKTSSVVPVRSFSQSPIRSPGASTAPQTDGNGGSNGANSVSDASNHGTLRGTAQVGRAQVSDASHHGAAQREAHYAENSDAGAWSDKGFSRKASGTDVTPSVAFEGAALHTRALHHVGIKNANVISMKQLFQDDMYKDDDPDDGEWVKVSGNAYGAFIHVALQSGVGRAVIKTGPMVVMSVMIQCIFAEELISQHILTVQGKNARVAEMICWVPVKLQISALLIFLTLMFHNIPAMLNSTRLALCSTHHKGGDGKHVGSESTEHANHDLDTVHAVKCALDKRCVIFCIAVLSEILSWGAILLAGMLFAFTAETVDLVIRSTVSVMFVLNIDEIVFEACCPTSVKEDVDETEYRLPNVYKWMTPTMEHYIGHYYGVYGHLPMLLACSSIVIFVLRSNYIGCTQHVLWQADHVKGVTPWPGGLPEENWVN